jgi:hypothetical protein
MDTEQWLAEFSRLLQRQQDLSDYWTRLQRDRPKDSGVRPAPRAFMRALERQLTKERKHLDNMRKLGEKFSSHLDHSPPEVAADPLIGQAIAGFERALGEGT